MTAPSARDAANGSPRHTPDPEGATDAAETISAAIVRKVAEYGCDRAPDVCDDCRSIAEDTVVIVLRELAPALLQRGDERNAADDGKGPDCEGDTCVHDDCHTISAVATWSRAAAMTRHLADEIDHANTHQENP